MKKIRILVLFAFPFFVISCGLSANERAAINIQLQNAQRIEQQLQTNLSDTQAQLAVENDKMQRVKEFQLFRTNVERDEQIKAQALRIDAVQKQIQSIQTRISNTDVQISKFQAELKG